MVGAGTGELTIEPDGAGVIWLVSTALEDESPNPSSTVLQPPRRTAVTDVMTTAVNFIDALLPARRCLPDVLLNPTRCAASLGIRTIPVSPGNMASA
ncbi:hypothetical protein ACFSKM_15320 [Ancylobacter dichloromethanicus]